MTYQGIIHEFRDELNIPAGIQVVTLHEGNTPLIPMQPIAERMGIDLELWVKFEGVNPTGSFKDRGMTVAISEAKHRGAKTVICASTGNTAASAAAYAARANMKAIVIIPSGKVAVGKLAGAIAYGAEVFQISGSFDEALKIVMSISERHPIALVNSINPYRLEGQKTAAFEICNTLETAPDWLAIPVGNAGNITAYWMGFRQYSEKKGTGLPKLLGVQAQGAAPLVLGHPIENPETIATAIRIGKPARGEEAVLAAQESKGKIIAVNDELIIESQKLLAKNGLWVEPASAAGLAGLIQEVKSNKSEFANKKVVIVCTGHGLKDPDIITRDFASPKIFPADIRVLENLIIQNE